MTDPVVEKAPHQFGGVEYLVMNGDQIFGVVEPVAPQADPKARKWWRARVGRLVVGLFTGKNGRFVALNCVRDYWRTSRLREEARAL